MTKWIGPIGLRGVGAALAALRAEEHNLAGAAPRDAREDRDAPLHAVRQGRVLRPPGTTEGRCLTRTPLKVLRCI